MDSDLLRNIVEAALLAAGRPLAIKDLQALFAESEAPDTAEFEAILQTIEADCADRGYELRQTASGYRFQVRERFAPWVSRLWEERPQRYSRALLETLVLIAYRQPITRGDIEEIRGVSVSSQIIKTLQEREWVRVVGHRDVPGKPALYATTRQFLDYFNLRSLEELPALGELKDISELGGDLSLDLESVDGRLEPVGDREDLGGDAREDDRNEPQGQEALDTGGLPRDEPLPEADFPLSNVVPLNPASRRDGDYSNE